MVPKVNESETFPLEMEKAILPCGHDRKYLKAQLHGPVVLNQREGRLVMGLCGEEYACAQCEYFSEFAARDSCAALLAELKNMVETTREVMKLIDDGYLVRDISKDREPDWAIRQFKSIALLAKWMKQTETLAAIITKREG